MALEIALGGHVVMLHKKCSIFRAQRLLDLGQRPDVELALLALRIGVERGGERPLRRRHLAGEPADGLGRALPVQRIAGAGEAPAPAAREAGRCRRASSRNAAPASARRPNSARSRRRDGRRCRPRRCARACARSARRSARRRSAARRATAARTARIGKFRRAAQAAVGRVDRAAELHARAGRARCAPIVTLPAGRAPAVEPLHQRIAVLLDLVRLLAKQPRNLAQHVDEGRPADSARSSENKCRPRPARPSASETWSAASRPARPDDAAPTCRSGRCRAAPRDRL